MVTGLCAWCGKEYTADNSRTKCCSRECGHKYAGSRKKGKITKDYGNANCQYCGKKLTRSQMKRKNAFCSNSCGTKAYFSSNAADAERKERTDDFKNRFAELFGNEFQYVSGFVDCDKLVVIKCVKCQTERETSAQCVRRKRIAPCSLCLSIKRTEANAEAQRIKGEAQDAIMLSREHERELKTKQKSEEYIKAHTHTHVCSECGDTFTSITGRSKYCSNVCANRHNNHNKELKRRSRLKENGAIDWSVTLTKLIKRDKNTCHICGGKCNINDKYIDEQGTVICNNNYPSIDHIKAVVNGGTHSWENVKLAHRWCNSAKSDSDTYETKTGQMALAI